MILMRRAVRVGVQVLIAITLKVEDRPTPLIFFIGYIARN